MAFQLPRRRVAPFRPPACRGSRAAAKAARSAPISAQSEARQIETGYADVAEEAVQPAADDRADDADDDVGDDAAGRFPGHDPTSDQADDQPKHDHPENPHRVFSFSHTRSNRETAPPRWTIRHYEAYSPLPPWRACAFATAAASAAPRPERKSPPPEPAAFRCRPTSRRLRAAIETNAANADDAISQNNAAYDRIVAALERRRRRARRHRARVLQRQLQSPPASHAAEFDGRTLRLHRLAKLFRQGAANRRMPAGSATRASAAGATAINGVSFGLSDPRGGARAGHGEGRRGGSRQRRGASPGRPRCESSGSKASSSSDAPSGPVPLMRAAAMPAPADAVRPIQRQRDGLRHRRVRRRSREGRRNLRAPQRR